MRPSTALVPSPLRRAGLLAALVGLAVLAVGGTIRGRIWAEAPPGGDPAGDAGGAYESRRYRFLEKVDYAAFTDFVVHLEDLEATPGDATRAVVSQRDGQFEPRVLPVVQGTTVDWPNRDTIFHNVFSMSESTPFDLGYYKSGDEAKAVTFTRPGRIDVFCSIHKEMHCIVLVLPNPWFARADGRGRFEIPDVPAGTYRLRGWHERLPARTIEVTVPATGTVEVELPLGLWQLPKR